MKQITWSSLVGGLGLLCLLGIFALLASNGSLSVSPVPATSIVRSTVGMTASAVISRSHVISASHAITHVDWLTFTDLEAGYSVQYPGDSGINTASIKSEAYGILGISFNLPSVRGYQGMSIRVEPNPQNLSIDRIVNNIYQRINSKSFDVRTANALEQIEVTGMAAYKTDVLPGNTEFHILLPYKDKVYIFALGYDIAAEEASPEAKILFYQILDTFQIIP